MTDSTREHLIDAAEKLFAEKGFYGASIAAVAEELGLTKQALLHHFGTKEKLYGQVLERLSGNLMAVTRDITGSDLPPAAQLEELIVTQYRMLMKHQNAARIIMRELLDNEQRATRAGNWYLKPYLEALVGTACAIDTLRNFSRPRVFALVYQLLGAAHYFTVSRPTLRKISGRSLYAQTQACYEEELRLLIRARFALK